MTEQVKGSQCTAKSKRSGERCKRVVRGGGVCRMHGGAAPAVRAKQLARVAVQQAALDVRSVNPSMAPASPGEVMLDQMQSARERVAGLEGLVGQQTSAPGLSLQGTTEWLFRERELLQLVAELKPTKDIATMLGLSPHTVDTHRGNLMQKLNVHSIPELILYAVRKGIIA